MPRYRELICGVVAMFLASDACGASLADVSPPLRRDAECMLSVLKKVRGIDRVKLGISGSDGWAHPYLEYRAAPARGHRATIRFDVSKPDAGASSAYQFGIVLPGLFGGNETGPPDYGTGAISRRWKAECGVHVFVLFV